MIMVIAFAAVATAVFAHGTGWGGRGYMMGPGCSDCYGTVPCSGPTAADTQFFDETADLRRELHGKRFEYSELMRKQDADPEKVAKLGKEIDDLMDKIREKGPRNAYGRKGGGFGCRW